MNMSEVMMRLGLYHEAIQYLDSSSAKGVVDVLYPYYYNLRHTLYGLMADFAMSEVQQTSYLSLKRLYTDSLMQVQEPGSFYREVVRADGLCADGLYAQALDVLSRYESQHAISADQQAISAITKAQIYHKLGWTEQEKEQLIISACSDMQAAIREYISLRELALLLYREGDIDDAYRYMRSAIEDAKAGCARGRTIELGMLYPIIERAYQKQDEAHHRLLIGFLSSVVLVAAMLLMFLLFNARQRRKLASLNKQLQATYSELKESDQIKAVYVGRYMEMSSLLIDRFDSWRKALNQQFKNNEIDKVQRNTFNGDPSSALLEVLDPEQNCHFHDNYLGLDYDLSKVFFIATANSLADIQPALLDRMEVIDFSGYVLQEKLEIAKRHLLPRIMKENAVDGRTLKFAPEVIAKVVTEYTREGGVRQLEKQLSKLVRHRVVMMESGEKCKASVEADEVASVLGLPIHNSERAQRVPREGVVTGLAWTPVGGEILFIESSLSRGKGSLSMTGNLGDVMKESATLAFEYLKANCSRFGIDQKTIDGSYIHIHVPEGATPKDGPSAGITIFVAMVSAFSHRKVLPHVAMTGEITLRGDVTAVGGIKEKILAAKRSGITDIILSSDNRRDVEDITPSYIEGLQFHYIDSMCDALPLALEPAKKTHRAKKTA